MTTTKLSQEDIAWLERQLSDAIAFAPVQPRREFIDRAREELRTIQPVRPLPHWVKPSVLVAVVLSLLALIGGLLYFNRRES